MDHSFHYLPSIYRTGDAEVVLHLLAQHLPFCSLLDVECGTGTWLKVATSGLEITDVQGVDASPYDADLFHIPAGQYLQHNLAEPLWLQRSFDLVICLEVAEHLPLAAAHTLVNSLVAHGDVILFSAAIPGQGGQNHINEQWQSWWQQLFEKAGYKAIDLLRPLVWEHPDVQPWYKQNMLLYVKNNHPLAQQQTPVPIANLVHPEIYHWKLQRVQELAVVKEKAIFYPSLGFALKSLLKSILITPFRK